MQDRPLSGVVKEVTSGFVNLVRSEIKLARTEAAQNLRQTGAKVKRSAVFACVAALGSLALLAAVIIGLGDLLGERYALSSFLIGVALAVPGFTLMFRSFRELDPAATLPSFAQSVQKDGDMISQHLHEIVETPNQAIQQTRVS